MRKALIMLGQLSEADIGWIATAGERVTYAAGATLIRQGVASPHLFILLDGLAVVSVGGRELARLSAGELLGEISLVDRQPPAADVAAGMETVALAIDKERLRAKLAADPGFAGRFYHAVAIFLADRLRAANAQIARAHGMETPDEAAAENELGDEVLDTVYLAGAKFDTLLKRSLKG